MAKEGLTTRPWYRWSPRDFLADPAVAAMDREERWRYRDALDYSWLSETPGRASEDQWRRWLGYSTAEWDSRRERFAAAFAVDAIAWTQKRMALEFDHATETSRKRSDAGAKGQASLASKSRANAEHLPGGCRAVALERERGEEEEASTVIANAITPSTGVKGASDSQNRSGATNGTPDGHGFTLTAPGSPCAKDGSHAANGSGSGAAKRRLSASKDWQESFDEHFWPAYLRKVGKDDARRRWNKLGLSDEARADEPAFFNRIMDGLDRWNRLHKDDELQYIPHPAVWLNKGRYEDTDK